MISTKLRAFLSLQKVRSFLRSILLLKTIVRRNRSDFDDFISRKSAGKAAARAASNE